MTINTKIWFSTKGIIFILLNALMLILTVWFVEIINTCSRYTPFLEKIAPYIIFIIILLIGIKYHSHLKKINYWLIFLIVSFFLICAVEQSSANLARCKGHDAATKESLREAQKKAKLYFETNKTYKGICTTLNPVTPYLKGAARVLSQKNVMTSGAFVYSVDGLPNSSVCHDNETGWAAVSSLISTYKVLNAGFCVDSTGAFSATTTSLLEGDTTCN